MTIKRTLMTLVMAIAALGLVMAQDAADQARVAVAENEQFPNGYLTDEEGMALYVFLDMEAFQAAQDAGERYTEGIRDSAVSCTGDCLEAWPAFTAEGEVAAGEGIDEELLYTEEFDGRNHVVYNGWPLFYFVRDEEPGQVNGDAVEGFGGTWHVITPDGSLPATVAGGGTPEAPAGGGEDGDDAQDGNGEGMGSDY